MGRCRCRKGEAFADKKLQTDSVYFLYLTPLKIYQHNTSKYTDMIAPIGQAVPDTPHAVSVSLPTWRSNIGYEEGEDWVIKSMQTGYPRFFVHLTIQELEREVISRFGHEGERVILFPSRRTARRCQEFFHEKRPGIVGVRLVHLEPDFRKGKSMGYVASNLSCCFFPEKEAGIAKQVWQHTGTGVSSRRGEFCLQALREGFLKETQSHSPQNSSSQDLFSKGPKRYQRGTSQHTINAEEIAAPLPTNGHNSSEEATLRDYAQFVEERFGRNLNAQLAAHAKIAVRRRIAGCLTQDLELEAALEASENCQQQKTQEHKVPEAQLRNVSEHDVYLYSTGMTAIYQAHLAAMQCSRKRTQQDLRSICFGFPYIDTLKVLEKWGPGALFYGQGDDNDLDDLERRLDSGERFASLFTEFPSNPLLRSPNLARIRKLADQYDFAVVVDETVGNYININVLPYTDIVVSSLTKIFSGDSNVMGGSAILNTNSRLYDSLKQIYSHEYEDNYWAEDAVFMERNSRDYIGRIVRINTNAEIMTDLLQQSPLVKEVYYPKLVPSRKYYDACRTPEGGYGGLYSVTFHDPQHAHQFFDNLMVQKGPSLGTNFTLSCPFVLLAHYNELDWARGLGVDPDLVRVSVGLENEEALRKITHDALAAIVTKPL